MLLTTAASYALRHGHFAATLPRRWLMPRQLPPHYATLHNDTHTRRHYCYAIATPLITRPATAAERLLALGNNTACRHISDRSRRIAYYAATQHTFINTGISDKASSPARHATRYYVGRHCCHINVRAPLLSLLLPYAAGQLPCCAGHCHGAVAAWAAIAFTTTTPLRHNTTTLGLMAAAATATWPRHYAQCASPFAVTPT